MARAKAKLSQKRAGKKFPNAEYTPEKKKDRKRAREKRREKRERRKEKPREEPKPPTPDREEPPAEIDFLIDRIYDKIDDIAGKMIPNISDAVSEICRSAFADFLSQVTEDMKGLAQALRDILTDPLLNQDIYDSDQIQVAESWSQELSSIANHLKSEQLSQLAEQVADVEEITDEEWLDIPEENDFLQFL